MLYHHEPHKKWFCWTFSITKYRNYVKYLLWAFCCAVKSHFAAAFCWAYMLNLCLFLSRLRQRNIDLNFMLVFRANVQIPWTQTWHWVHFVSSTKTSGRVPPLFWTNSPRLLLCKPSSYVAAPTVVVQAFPVCCWVDVKVHTLSLHTVYYCTLCNVCNPLHWTRKPLWLLIGSLLCSLFVNVTSGMFNLGMWFWCT